MSVNRNYCINAATNCKTILAVDVDKGLILLFTFPLYIALSSYVLDSRDQQNGDQL